MKNWLKLIIAIAIPLAVGFTSSIFTMEGVNGWYRTINKPSWNPPNYIFGPIWTTLYILMGIALYMIWVSNGSKTKKNRPFILFTIQLILNFFWSYIFFSAHEIGWAFVEIVALWLFILFTIFSFASVNKKAAWLMVPYISWVSFAAILNYTIWILNK